MTDKTWIGDTGAQGTGNYDTNEDWTPAGEAPDPGGADNVYIGGLGTSYTVTVDNEAFGADAADNLVLNDPGLVFSIGAATLTVLDSTTITAGTISMAGGQLSIGLNGGNFAAGTTITGFGTLINAVSGTGTIEAAGGVLDLSDPIGSVGLHFKIAAGGTLQLDSSVAAGDIFTFEDRGGLLSLGTASTTFDGTVAGLIDGATGAAVNGILVSGTGITASYSAGLITLSNGATIHLDPGDAYTNTTHADVSIVNGNTEVFLYDTQVCYAAGTRIMTERGEVAVEALAEGDMVATADQGLQPVRWIGHRHLDLTVHPRPEFAAPIRISRGAFAANQPQRDLIVSPDHCLFVDGKLIPAKLLINGMTIVQDRDASAVTYYHVELDHHAVLFAEGLPAESYLDTGNRAFFSNAGLALMLHPEFHVNAGLNCWEQDACAPLAVSDTAVHPVWQKLASRATALGFTQPEILTTNDADLHLVAAGRVFRPISAHANRFVFVLPAGVSDVHLTSRAGSPADVRPWLEDHRQLGVAVSRIVVRGGTDFTDVAIDHPALRRGWHAVETEERGMWRWTNGNAVLPIGGNNGPVTVEVHVRQTSNYLVAMSQSAARLAA